MPSRPRCRARTASWPAGWRRATRRTRAGRPLPLPRITPAGRPSFESLVASVTRDVRAPAVLDEWVDRRIAILDADDMVTLRERAVVPQRGGDAQLHCFGRNLHHHMAAAVADISAEPPPFFERAIHYDGLSPEVVATLERRSGELAMDALTAADREAYEATAPDAGGGWPWNFGLYVYAEEPAPEARGPA